MPMPKPKDNESKDKFISRFMENEDMKKEYPEKEQRLAVANSTWEDNNKKSKETNIKVSPSKISYREEEGEFYSEGFICTTHVDRFKEGEYEGTMLSYRALEQIRDAINNEVAPEGELGSTRTASYRHDWVKQDNPGLDPAGMATPSAEIRQTEDGQYGVWVQTHHNKNHELYDKIIYEVSHGYLPGYSIEFKEGDSESIRVKGKLVKLIKNIRGFFGYAFANARMIANPHALISDMGYREIIEQNDKTKTKEATTMISEEKYNALKKKKDDGEELSDEEKKQMQEFEDSKKEKESKSEDKKEEKKEEKKDEKKSKEAEPESKPEEEKTEEKVEVKEETKSESSESEEEKVETKEAKKNVAEEVIQTKEYQEAVNNVKPEKKVKIKEEDKMENAPKIREVQESLSKVNLETREGLVNYREAVSNYIDSQPDYFNKVLSNPSNYSVGFDSNLKVRTVGKGLVVSGDIKVRDTLGTGDNTSSYSQADVEFADMFAPGIIDTFNNQTNLFGFLKKEQHVGGEHYQWRMLTNRDPNGTSTFVGHNDVSITGNFSSKGKYQTPLKIARRGVSVTDFINRYSARAIGDLFQLELDAQMNEMMKDVNQALFAEVADGTGNAPLGLEAVADSAGNTTLYGLTRSTANRLAPDTASDTYENIVGPVTEAKLREKVTYLETEGVSFGDIAIVASPTTRDYIMNILDGQRRFNTTEASFGFNKANVPSYDGTPILVDSDCNSDAIYFIDTSSDVVVVGMEPKIVQLAKTGAATEAYLEMHFAHVYKQPRRISMLDGLTA